VPIAAAARQTNNHRKGPANAMMRYLFRAYLLNRLLGGGRSHRHRRHRYGYGRRPRGRTGFFGPFPYYSGRTRGGSRVTVSGCCLPIPLAIVLTGAAALTRLLRSL
jgi:hypothetical protein